MTMEDRTGGIDRAAPATSTTATTALTSSSPSSITDATSDASYPLQRANKRSFDVAFLVAPDENLARRQSEKMRMASARKDRSRDEISLETVVDTDRLPQNLTVKNYNDNDASDVRRRMIHCTENSLSPPYISPRTLTPTLPTPLSPDTDVRRYVSGTRLQKSPSPPAFPTHQSMLTTCPEVVEPNLTCNKVYDTVLPCPADRHGESRSAFTKVNLTIQRNGFADDGQTSPRSSISPDDRTGYQSSVSPPVVPLTSTTGYKYAPFPTAKMPYPFLVGPENGQPGLLENLKIPQIAQPPKVPSPKIPSFRPDLPPVYPNLPYNPISVFPPMADALARPRFLATAAGVAGLLPPSFAALTLPAQNVCAKCNLSFRMTSDLVYHMRSHHKNENTGEAARRRREEKLRCPVCDESFRERHHLTRHMTAHQDKESDAIVDQVEVKRRATTVHTK